MAGKKTDIAPLAAAGAGQGVVLWAAQAPLGDALHAALQEQYPVTWHRALPAAPPSVGVVLLLARPPAGVLCAALNEGLELSAALAAAQEEAAAVLALKRQNRRRILLLDAAAARAAPSALLVYCGLPASEAAQASLQKAAGAAPDAVLLALARARLQAEPGLNRLEGEFAASAAALLPDADPDAALEAFLSGQAGAEERALLQAQQRSMYEQLETLYREKLQLERQLEQARGRFGSLQVEAEVLKGRLQAKAEVLAAAGARIAGLEQAAGAQAENVTRLKTQMQQLRNSRSFRLMAPMRRARRALRGKR
ncbi:hypothetical protein [Leisingera sp. ANG59]|uniref:hypothetical protein n=1 Tax=Leisingera sp. ANG59 TaxID=2675221 RepID=UPI001C2D513E|nr:hypothetical protein [Leisingera sp. ANG59]